MNLEIKHEDPKIVSQKKILIEKNKEKYKNTSPSVYIVGGFILLLLALIMIFTLLLVANTLISIVFTIICITSAKLSLTGVKSAFYKDSTLSIILGSIILASSLFLSTLGIGYVVYFLSLSF